MNVCVIGLKARKDRWARCKEILQGKFERVTHYTTVQDYSDSYKGYMTDWLKMLKMFRGQPLMFFEDDFEFTDEFDDVFDKAVAELPKPILAYCRSGARSTALYQASSGR